MRCGSCGEECLPKPKKRVVERLDVYAHSGESFPTDELQKLKDARAECSSAFDVLMGALDEAASSVQNLVAAETTTRRELSTAAGGACDEPTAAVGNSVRVDQVPFPCDAPRMAPKKHVTPTLTPQQAARAAEVVQGAVQRFDGTFDELESAL